MLKIEIKNGLLLKHTGYLVAHLLCYRNSLYWEENVLRQQQIPFWYRRCCRRRRHGRCHRSSSSAKQIIVNNVIRVVTAALTLINK